MKIAITADSTIDMTDELKEKYGVQTIPFHIVLGDSTYEDGANIEPKQIFDYVSKTKVLPKTTAINIFEYHEFFDKVKKDYDAIIHLSLSSEISSAYSNANMASKEVGNVYVVDTRSLSTGMACSAIYASKLICQGVDTPEQIFDKVQSRVSSVQASFVVEKLDYLYKGGRCGGLALLGANLLKIRPCIQLENGKMVNKRKYRGKMESVVQEYVKDTLKLNADPDHDFVFVTYTSATQGMLDAVRQELKEYGKFKNIYETLAGSTITSHCGENTLGILYYNDGSKNL